MNVGAGVTKKARIVIHSEIGDFGMALEVFIQLLDIAYMQMIRRFVEEKEIRSH